MCNITNRECILEICENCPGFDEATNFIRNKVVEKFGNVIIQFKQWQKVDRSTLIKVELDSSDFIDDIIEKLKELLPHHFIYKHQEWYIKTKKENLLANECIVILGFAENYTFVVYNAIQSFH